ncbi:MAG: RNA polymerase factor sigma-54 [Alphaproteobacteria bacterium]|nr:RNA polymerase factor sigma-54 [Alphaproteobacteria bacterium]
MAMIGLSFRPDLHMRAELRQTLTPQQRQLVDVLELPDVSVEGYLEEMLTANPALSRMPDARLGREVKKAFARKASDDDLPPIEARLSASSDLVENLVDQLRLERTTEEERAAAFAIIGNLDGHGLLEMDLDEVAFEAGVTRQEAEDAQWIVMRLDPLGCGASDLIHYLAFMVEQQWPDDPFFPDILRHHLDDLRRSRFDLVAKAMELEEEDVEEYYRMLVEEVDPYPARGYSDVDPDYVRPCMDVSRNADTGRWEVQMHDPPRAPVRLDPAFEAKVRALPDGAERREALEKIEQARWVIRSLEERHSLVKQVAEIAVRTQNAFFEKGPVHIQNLTMADVAEELGRDTSTVSRAVMGRYFQWDQGTMALRALFVNRGGGQDTSEAKLHAAIEDIVAKENKRSPLSDDAIAKELKRRGLTGVARRTVAKHRERVGIPSSRDRRER